MLEISLCNELLAADGLDLDRQCAVAAELGYCGLELAPATLAERPDEMSPAEVDRVRRTVERHGLRVTGLHWLLTAWPGASITEPEKQPETARLLARLVDICADLGGRVLVHGSPGQRVRPEGLGDADLLARLASFFAPLAERAGDRGVTYCIEPLAREETATVNTVQDGAELVRMVGRPAFRTMIDTSAAGRTEPPVADLIARWGRDPAVAHLHLNDTNRGGPGMGQDPFPDIVAAILGTGWSRPVTVEPFRTCVDASVTAGIAIATLRACERAAA